MKIVIVYIYAVVAGRHFENYAMRFLESYHAFPPGVEHDTVVVLNGIKKNSESTCMFSSLPNLMFLEHDNSGYDIGGFQLAARTIPCDMIVFFGASTFFQRQGWLFRMRSAFVNHGNAQYGAMGNRGDQAVKVWPHIRTTAFWMAPTLMNSYPHIVTRGEERHPFEHGQNCFTNWVKRQGLLSYVVTWTSELLWKDWDSDPNGFSRGNQSSLLAGDHLCERPYYPNGKCRHPSMQNGSCVPWSTNNCWLCLNRHL